MSEITRLSNHSDAYLAYYRDTEAANENVMKAMAYWFHMVNLATDRAIEMLDMPGANVVQMFPRDWPVDYDLPPSA